MAEKRRKRAAIFIALALPVSGLILAFRYFVLGVFP